MIAAQATTLALVAAALCFGLSHGSQRSLVYVDNDENLQISSADSKDLVLNNVSWGESVLYRTSLLVSVSKTIHHLLRNAIKARFFSSRLEYFSKKVILIYWNYQYLMMVTKCHHLFVLNMNQAQLYRKSCRCEQRWMLLDQN
jgi:hypothetical protein